MERQQKSNSKNNALNNLKNIDIKTNHTNKTKKWSVANVVEFKKNKNNEVIFSFKFYDRLHKAFNLGSLNRICDNWFIELLDCFKEVSSRTWSQLITTSKFDAHPHDFDKTNYAYELFDKESLEQLDCVQFRISKSYGRVHGFLIDNCFYIYWLDSNHNMNNSVGYGGVNLVYPAKSCNDILSENNALLINENENLKNKIKYIEDNIDEDKYDLLDELIKRDDEIILLRENNQKLLRLIEENQD